MISIPAEVLPITLLSGNSLKIFTVDRRPAGLIFKQTDALNFFLVGQIKFVETVGRNQDKVAGFHDYLHPAVVQTADFKHARTAQHKAHFVVGVQMLAHEFLAEGREIIHLGPHTDLIHGDIAALFHQLFQRSAVFGLVGLELLISDALRV